MFSSGNALPCNAVSRILAALLAVVASLPGLADTEEVTHDYGRLTLNANLVMADGKQFEDGMVLIVHGLMGHNRMEIIEKSQILLQEQGLSSLAINISLGVNSRHGYLNCDMPHRHLQDDAIGEISSWVNWLRERGTTRIILMAHSRGANQAMVYAVEKLDPEVTRLVLLAPGTGLSKRSFEERWGDGYDATLARAQQLVAAGKGEELMEDVDMLYCPRVAATANAWISYYGDHRFRRFQEYLPRVQVPTLIVAGTIDERFPNIEKDVKPYIDGKKVQLSIIEGSGHFFRDFNIDEAMEAAMDFLASVE